MFIPLWKILLNIESGAQTGQIFNIFFLTENWIFQEQILIMFLLTYKLKIPFWKVYLFLVKGYYLTLIISFPDISNIYYTTQLLFNKFSAHQN